VRSLTRDTGASKPFILAWNYVLAGLPTSILDVKVPYDGDWLFDVQVSGYATSTGLVIVGIGFDGNYLGASYPQGAQAMEYFNEASSHRPLQNARILARGVKAGSHHFDLRNDSLAAMDTSDRAQVIGHWLG
jgi:hypothetical protein